MAKKGAMRRDPKVSTRPVRGEGEQTMTDEATRRAANRAARRAPTERLSPGVYRSASGDLVTGRGRPIQRQPQASMAQPTQQVMPQGQPPMEDQFFQPSPGDVGQQVNKPFPMDGLGNFNLGSIGKTPPGWSGGGSYDPSLNQGPMQNLIYRMPYGPQMPQPSANMGGQYRLSPGVYGTRDQAMQQYNQQLNNMGIQGGPMMTQPAFIPYGQRRG